MDAPGQQTHWQYLADTAWYHVENDAYGVIVYIPAGLAQQEVMRRWRLLAKQSRKVDECYIYDNGDVVKNIVETIIDDGIPQGDCIDNDKFNELLCQTNDRKIWLIIIDETIVIKQQYEIIEFVKKWAHFAFAKHETDDACPEMPRLLLAVNSLPSQFSSDVGSKILHGWTFPAHISESHISLVYGNQLKPVELWQYCTFPELAAYDTQLFIAPGWDQVTDIEPLQEMLAAVCSQRGWNTFTRETQSAIAQIHSPGTLINYPFNQVYLPEWLIHLWQQGIIGPVIGRGWDLHAAVICKHRPLSDLQYRIWRGQSRILWSLLGNLYTAIEAKLRRDLGNELFEIKRNEIINNEEHSEKLSDNKFSSNMLVLSKIMQYKSSNEYITLNRLCRECHLDIRNALAHQQVISSDLLRSLCTLINSLPVYQ